MQRKRTPQRAFWLATGKRRNRWNREEIGKGFDTLFAHDAKKNATYFVAATRVETSELPPTRLMAELEESHQDRRMSRMSDERGVMPSEESVGRLSDGGNANIRQRDSRYLAVPTTGTGSNLNFVADWEAS
jgi:hypothetical protein